MSVFLGTIENKLDAKGRVSVPAAFRSTLSAQGSSCVVAFPSFREGEKALYCCSLQFMMSLSQKMNEMDFFSDEQEELADLVFATSHQLVIENTGRITLPDELLAFAELKDKASFVGRGETFQIWNPDNFRSQHQERLRRAREKRLTLKMGSEAKS